MVHLQQTSIVVWLSVLISHRKETYATKVSVEMYMPKAAPPMYAHLNSFTNTFHSVKNSIVSQGIKIFQSLTMILLSKCVPWTSFSLSRQPDKAPFSEDQGWRTTGTENRSTRKLFVTLIGFIPVLIKKHNQSIISFFVLFFVKLTACTNVL